jgi:hypothetical protein
LSPIPGCPQKFIIRCRLKLARAVGFYLDLDPKSYCNCLSELLNFERAGEVMLNSRRSIGFPVCCRLQVAVAPATCLEIIASVTSLQLETESARVGLIMQCNMKIDQLASSYIDMVQNVAESAGGHLASLIPITRCFLSALLADTMSANRAGMSTSRFVVSRRLRRGGDPNRKPD